MATIVGIDEAGRGPLIGPLVICGILIEEGDEKELIKLKVKDSKLLSPIQRERIYAELIKLYQYKLIHISPIEIDASVGKDSTNLNWLEAEKAVEIINALKPDKVILDCPSPNIKAYTNFINHRITQKTDLICAHHADLNYPVVGAASIIAKVTRDREIDAIKKKIGNNFGSGYMADPRTKELMHKYWDVYPEIFRHSWAPFKKFIGNFTQKDLAGF
jgi:ribonuclease HII